MKDVYRNKDYFSLCLDLKALIEGAILVSKSRLFQRLVPRYTKDFWQMPVLNMGIARSDLEFRKALVKRSNISPNISPNMVFGEMLDRLTTLLGHPTS